LEHAGKTKINIPEPFFTENSEGDIITNIDVVKFKDCFDKIISKRPDVIRSSELKHKYEKKHEMRKEVMQCLLDENVLVFGKVNPKPKPKGDLPEC
jgi:hypothetical protein